MSPMHCPLSGTYWRSRKSSSSLRGNYPSLPLPAGRRTGVSSQSSELQVAADPFSGRRVLITGLHGDQPHCTRPVPPLRTHGGQRGRERAGTCLSPPEVSWAELRATDSSNRIYRPQMSSRSRTPRHSSPLAACRARPSWRFPASRRSQRGGSARPPRSRWRLPQRGCGGAPTKSSLKWEPGAFLLRFPPFRAPGGSAGRLLPCCRKRRKALGSGLGGAEVAEVDRGGGGGQRR